MFYYQDFDAKWKYYYAHFAGYKLGKAFGQLLTWCTFHDFNSSNSTLWEGSCTKIGVLLSIEFKNRTDVFENEKCYRSKTHWKRLMLVSPTADLSYIPTNDGEGSKSGKKNHNNWKSGAYSHPPFFVVFPFLGRGGGGCGLWYATISLALSFWIFRTHPLKMATKLCLDALKWNARKVCSNCTEIKQKNIWRTEIVVMQF